MTIPGAQEFMLPLLKFYSDGQEHTLREAIDEMASKFSITDEERKIMVPSGTDVVLNNRIRWAKFSMRKAGFLESPRRGVHRITELGLNELNKNPQAIDLKYLKKFQSPDKPEEIVEVESHHETENVTPEEMLGVAHEKIISDLAEDILQRLNECSPRFFERLVVEVIVRMGYGGSIRDAGQAIGKSGDEGIDGIIKEDKLGLDAIYIQAKRWGSTVGRPEIQKFVGALTGKRAKKGIFITTSDFSREARDYVTNIDCKVVLIDGEPLAQLMIDHNVGVSTVANFELKKVDSDYFLEE